MSICTELGISPALEKRIYDAYDQDNLQAMIPCAKAFWVNAVEYINDLLEEDGYLVEFDSQPEGMIWTLQHTKRKSYATLTDAFIDLLANQFRHYAADEAGIEKSILKTRNWILGKL